jgi:hypothetical protein
VNLCEVCGEDLPTDPEEVVQIPGIGAMHKPGTPGCTSNLAELVSHGARLVMSSRFAEMWDKPRDPDRIGRLLTEIERIWRLHPDLRLAQLLMNATGDLNYNQEDEELLEALKKVYP